MKLLCLKYFSHIVCSFSFYPPITTVKQMGKSEKIARGSFCFPSEIVLTSESLESYVSWLHGRPSQMNSDTFVIARGSRSCLVRAEGKDSRFPGAHALPLPLSNRSRGSREIKQHWRPLRREEFPSSSWVLSSAITHQELHGV